MHVLIAFLWIIQVEVGNVGSGKAGPRGRDDAIEKGLDGGEVCSESGDLARIINAVTANCKPDTLSFRLEWAFLGNNA